MTLSLFNSAMWSLDMFQPDPLDRCNLLHIPASQSKFRFQVQRPWTVKYLPDYLKVVDNLVFLKGNLKSYLFSLAYN